eukprot:12820-Rhodomonas_salina.1
MQWLASPYSNRDGKHSLNSMFAVEGIPALVIIGPAGSTINAEARSAVNSDLDCDNFPWAKAAQLHLQAPSDAITMQREESGESQEMEPEVGAVSIDSPLCIAPLAISDSVVASAGVLTPGLDAQVGKGTKRCLLFDLIINFVTEGDTLVENMDRGAEHGLIAFSLFEVTPATAALAPFLI